MPVADVTYTLTIDSLSSNTWIVSYIGPIYTIDLRNLSGSSTVSVNSGSNINVKATVKDSGDHPIVGLTSVSLVGDDTSSYSGTGNGDGTYTFSSVTSNSYGSIIYTVTIDSVVSNNFTVTYV